MLGRIIWTVVVFFGYWLANTLYTPMAALQSAQIAGKQLKGMDDLTKIENVFISVRDARHLTDVTDDVIFTEVHNLVCKYIAVKDNPEAASANMNEIMASVTTDLVTYASRLGITVKSLGWADTWTFDHDVQFAMNQKFNAQMVGGILDTLERNAAVNLKEGMAIGFRTKMPNVLFLGSPELMGVAASGAAARTAGSAITPTTVK